MSAAQEVFDESVRPLTVNERVRLASLILQDLAQADLQVIDISGSWTEQDMLDATAFSLGHAEALYPEDEEIA